MHWHAWHTSPTPHKPTQDLKPRGQEQTVTDYQCAWLFTSYHPRWLFYTFFKPPMERDPARRVCSTPGPGGRGQAMTVPAWCHLRGSKAGEEPPCTRCMEDIPTCLPKASEWDKEPVRATGCLLGGQGAACRLWYQAGGARGGWPECRPHLQ